jgi:uncharacterized membrane protein YuzA (DUF378 family)
MKNIENIKFICGLTLLAFAIVGGLIFFLESFKILDSVLSTADTSQIWEDGYGEGSGASQTPIFLGICGLAGAYLLASVKPIKTETKKDIGSDQPIK